MEEHPLEQSVWSRARYETLRSYHRLYFFAGVEVIAMGAFIYLATVLVPEDANRYVSAVYPAIGAVVGAIVGFGIIFVICLLLAPYKQRNEARNLLEARPKPIPISNRDELIRAINKYGDISAEVFEYQDQLDQRTQVSPYTVDTALMRKLSEALNSYKTFLIALDAELSVAGQEYRTCVSNLIDFIKVQLLLKEKKVEQLGGDEPTLLNKKDYAIRLAHLLDETLRGIDEISGRVPDKKGYQP